MFKYILFDKINVIHLAVYDYTRQFGVTFTIRNTINYFANAGYSVRSERKKNSIQKY